MPIQTKNESTFGGPAPLAGLSSNRLGTRPAIGGSGTSANMFAQSKDSEKMQDSGKFGGIGSKPTALVNSVSAKRFQNNPIPSQSSGSPKVPTIGLKPSILHSGVNRVRDNSMPPTIAPKVSRPAIGGKKMEIKGGLKPFGSGLDGGIPTMAVPTNNRRMITPSPEKKEVKKVASPKNWGNSNSKDLEAMPEEEISDENSVKDGSFYNGKKSGMSGNKSPIVSNDWNESVKSSMNPSNRVSPSRAIVQNAI